MKKTLSIALLCLRSHSMTVCKMQLFLKRWICFYQMHFEPGWCGWDYVTLTTEPWIRKKTFKGLNVQNETPFSGGFYDDDVLHKLIYLLSDSWQLWLMLCTVVNATGHWASQQRSERQEPSCWNSLLVWCDSQCVSGGYTCRYCNHVGHTSSQGQPTVINTWVKTTDTEMSYVCQNRKKVCNVLLFVVVILYVAHWDGLSDLMCMRTPPSRMLLKGIFTFAGSPNLVKMS